MIHRLELGDEELRFLRDQVLVRSKELEDELVHTEKFELQRALARDSDRLRSILHKLEAKLESESEDAIA